MRGTVGQPGDRKGRPYGQKPENEATHGVGGWEYLVAEWVKGR